MLDNLVNKKSPPHYFGKEDNMKKTWFAVKTLYFQEAKGTVKNKDKSYSKPTVALEERIVLFQTKNYKKAAQLAEKEAKKYAKRSFKNAYGEKVTTTYSGFFDVVQCSDKPDDGIEVYSLKDIHLTRAGLNLTMKVKSGFSYRKNDKYSKRFLPK